jgi:integrase/recombinase XerC
VKLGQWKPPAAQEVAQAPTEIPSFHVFSSEWWERHGDQLAPKTQIDYRWRLNHLLLFFETYTLDAIDVDAVDRFVSQKLRGRLSGRSVNMLVILLAQILEDGVERGLIVSNPARGKRRKAKERTPSRPFLQNAVHIEALLNAAGERDREARGDRRHIERRAILATLVFAGLRISELCELRWRSVDLANGWLEVAESKTDAGRGRRIKLRKALRDELTELRARVEGGADDHVFATRTGRAPVQNNVRTRVLAVAIERANERLAQNDLPPLPVKLTPHALRRTFASVLYALAEPPPVVMQEMGHTDPKLALRVYAQVMRRGEDETAALRRLVEGSEMAANGSRSENGSAGAPEHIVKTPMDSGFPGL